MIMAMRGFKCQRIKIVCGFDSHEWLRRCKYGRSRFRLVRQPPNMFLCSDANIFRTSASCRHSCMKKMLMYFLNNLYHAFQSIISNIRIWYDATTPNHTKWIKDVGVYRQWRCQSAQIDAYYMGNICICNVNNKQI